ncbi:hypothetical protein MRX96_040608 [Rhipicephalus microplus]
MTYGKFRSPFPPGPRHFTEMRGNFVFCLLATSAKDSSVTELKYHDFARSFTLKRLVYEPPAVYTGGTVYTKKPSLRLMGRSSHTL